MSSAIPAPPGAAVTLFGPAIALAERFTSLLAYPRGGAGADRSP